jgi:hypothetical protein
VRAANSGRKEGRQASDPRRASQYASPRLTLGLCQSHPARRLVDVPLNLLQRADDLIK